MPKNNVIRTNVANYFAQSSYRDLKTYFGNVVKGQPNVYDTPFARGESTEALLSSWNKELVSISDEWPSLYEFEMDLASKVGPMSVRLPLKERMKDIDHYYDDIHQSSTRVHPRAVAATLAEWGPARGLDVRATLRTVDKMKKSTNSGSPFFTKRRNVVNETIPVRIFDNGVAVRQVLQGHSWSACAVLGWRGQEGGESKEDVKQRVVWMFPFAVNIEELRVYQPLIEAAQRFDIVPAWVSMESVDRRVTKLFDTKSSDDLVICTDFSKFDQHFNSRLSDVARHLLANVFKPTASMADWLEHVFPVKYNIPMMFDFGYIKTGEHGMGSGSGGTNADETLAHRALQYEAAILSGQMLNPNSMCLGDDGILSYPGCTVKDVVAAYTSHGLEMNDSKQYASTQDCIYLRRWHHANYRIDGVCAGVYSTMRALGRLRYLERYYDPEVWGPEAVALRQLSILENVKNHPLRDQFVEFCMKRDKYRLGIDIPDFLENIEVEARKVIDYVPDFLGYTKTLQSGETDPVKGMANWWIINYLKSKA